MIKTPDRHISEKDSSGPGASHATNWLLWFGILFFLLPVLYVLSIGPVAFLYERMNWDITYIKAFYGPVIWLHDHTFLERPLELYLQLFGVH